MHFIGQINVFDQCILLDKYIYWTDAFISLKASLKALSESHDHWSTLCFFLFFFHEWIVQHAFDYYLFILASLREANQRDGHRRRNHSSEGALAGNQTVPTHHRMST